MKALLDWHRQNHPAMEALDAVKLIFQSSMGCGHLLGDEITVVRRIEQEEATLIPDINELLTEPLGANYARLNLRRAMAEGICPLWIARMMRLSNIPLDNTAAIAALCNVAKTVNDAAYTEAMLQAAKRLEDDPSWLPSHSANYHAAYAPAYRVIPQAAVRLLPILSALARSWDKPRLLLAIDGPCGSGKTTLADILSKVVDAAVVPMDDFFLPHARKTAERLSQPGGNADWERVTRDFLEPWFRDGQAIYQPYDCHADQLGTPVAVPACKVTILEGSYSLMPDIAQYVDVRVFLTITPEEQRRRILHRNGETMLQRFIQRWIPLEHAYFKAFGLPDATCIIPDNHVQDV